VNRAGVVNRQGDSIINPSIDLVLARDDSLHQILNVNNFPRRVFRDWHKFLNFESKVASVMYPTSLLGVTAHIGNKVRSVNKTDSSSGTALPQDITPDWRAVAVLRGWQNKLVERRPGESSKWAALAIARQADKLGAQDWGSSHGSDGQRRCEEAARWLMFVDVHAQHFGHACCRELPPPFRHFVALLKPCSSRKSF
jgi:hypothetical protein